MAKGNSPIRVAVDAMGGDHAPGEVVAGAVEAARQGGVQVMLVGDPEAVHGELARHDTAGLPVVPVPSQGAILEDEQPAIALRQKPKASIVVATGMVKAGHADACVTMGSTGAAMASAAVLLGVMPGIGRPALGGPVLGMAPRTIVLDLGANVDCRPAQLVSFAAIGEVFARFFWEVDNPRIALLSVGSEAGKGNRQVRETTELLAGSGLNFVGNVEADDLPNGAADVVVCDGFVGNIVMKLTEGSGAALARRLTERLEGTLEREAIDALVREVRDLHSVVESHGGGPLLGVKGVSVVGHGRAKADAVSRAIGTAVRVVKIDLTSKVGEQLASLQQKLGSPA